MPVGLINGQKLSKHYGMELERNSYFIYLFNFSQLCQNWFLKKRKDLKKKSLISLTHTYKAVQLDCSTTLTLLWFYKRTQTGEWSLHVSIVIPPLRGLGLIWNCIFYPCVTDRIRHMWKPVSLLIQSASASSVTPWLFFFLDISSIITFTWLPFC